MKSSAALAAIVAVFFVGCAHQATEPIAVYRFQQMQHWYAQSNWQMEGRLGVVAPHDSFSATIHWQHEPDRDSVELAGPLGQGRVSLVITDEQLQVDDGEHIQIYRDPVGSSMQSQLGVDIPLRAIGFWLLGVVEPGVGYTIEESGFEQYGWRVFYRQLQEVEGAWLPRKIQMEKNDNKIRIIVDHWEIL